MKKLILLVSVITGISSFSHAQKFNLVRGASTGKSIERAVAGKVLQKHPVFGYTAPLLSSDLAKAYPVTSDKVQSLDLQHTQGLIQTAPILSPANEPLKYIQAFSHTKSLSVAQLTQATYLYRLAHPTHQPGTDTQTPYLSGLLQKSKSLMAESSANLWQTDELPSIELLTRLQKAAFMPNSYAELVRLFPKAYPKHVTLNEEGIPVKTSQADMASVLDTYLMLSNRKQLGAFNNTKQGANYTPFILTPEEHAAANELLKSRLQNEQIPANPFADDLIEIAYNRLESHTIPYTQAAEAGAGYKAYPNYKNTYLYRAIKGMIEGQEPIVTIEGFTSLENKDITHLIVLDAIMGGIESNDWSGLGRALRAFDAFSASLKETPENIEYVRILQQNLRIVFTPVFNQYRNIPRNPKEARGTDVRWDAVWLLKRYKAGELVGRDFRQESHYF